MEQTENKTVEKKTKAKKTEAKVVETPATENKIEAKKAEVRTEKIIREVAVANLFSAQISTKHSIAICRMIKNKSPEKAVEMLEKVLLKKLAVPMIQSEIPHKRRGLIPHSNGGGARFPMNATREFINLVKQLQANCNNLGVENPVITIAMANLGSRPFKREGKRAKRAHVHLEARDRTKLKAGKK